MCVYVCVLDECHQMHGIHRQGRDGPQFVCMGRLHCTERLVMKMKKSQQELGGCPLWTWQAQRGPTGRAMSEPG
jgi:hypothetical protein